MTSSQKLRIFFLVPFLFLGYFLALSRSSETVVKISMDSAYILMGKQTSLNVEILESSHQEGYLVIPNDTLSKFIEIIAVSTPDTLSDKSKDGKSLIKQQIILQSFDSGLYPVGPLKYITGDGDTVISNPLSLKVIPVNVDSLETIHSFAPVIKPGSKWWDFLPDIILDYWLYCIIVLLICIAGFLTWLFMKKKVTVPFISKSKQISPYDQALKSLDVLKSQNLCEQGLEKEFYTELTDILRRYLEARFGINAMEMTSTQILNSLRNDAEINRHHNMVKKILEIADFVKFAKVRPLPSDNVASWNNAREFVIETKPVDLTENTEDINKETIENPNPQ